MNRRISISTHHLQEEYGDEKAICLAKEIGADAIDFATFTSNFDYRNPSSIYSKSEKAFISYFTRLRNIADEQGIEICQTHGRLTGFRNDKAEDDALIENGRLDCFAANILGAPVCVIHNVTTIHMGADADPGLMHDLNYDMFSRLLVHAKTYDVKLATETFGDATGLDCCDFFGNYDEFIKAYKRICSVGDNANYMTVCVDTGHSNKAVRYGNPSSAEIIRRLGNNVGVLHLNDNDGIFDQHKIPMTGNLNWNEIFEALDEIGYSGVYNMELNLRHFSDHLMVETAEFAVKVLKQKLAERYC